MAFFLPFVNVILTRIRTDLENRLNNEKSNNRIYNNDINNLNSRLNTLIHNYSNDIHSLTINVNNLERINDELIIRKDNMDNILINSAKSIEPSGYSNSKISEGFDPNCPYSSIGRSSDTVRSSDTSSAVGSSGTGVSSNTGTTGVSDSTVNIYNPTPHYTVDLQNKKDLESANSTNSLYKQYNYIINQNTILLQRQQYINNQFTRHNNKFEHYSNYISKLNVFNNMLFYLYYILILVLIFKLFLNTPDWSIYYKVFIIIILILFPLIAYTIEMLIYNAWIFSYSFLFGSVYNNMSYSNKVVLNNTTDLTTKE
jgi:hypothetical protein